MLSLQTVGKATIQEVIDHVLDGAPLREAISRCGLTPHKFAQALQGDRNLANAYARAVEIKADLMADEVVHLADGDGDPAKVRNQMQARQWLASKLYSKKYGDRIDLNVTQTLDIGATLAEARARLLPVRYQQDVIEGQVIDSQGENTPRLSDNESLSPADNAQPDIFS